MKFRKRPVVVEALQWTGQNVDLMLVFMPAAKFRAMPGKLNSQLYVETLEGVMTAQPGDWIIRGVAGEFYPCKTDIFDATYEAVT